MSAAKILAIVAVALSVCVTMAHAQEEQDEDVTKVVTIAHADARTIAEAVGNIDPWIEVTAAGPHLLLIRGPKSEVERVVRDVVEPMEEPQTGRASGSQPAFIPLPRTPSRDFSSMALAMLDPERRSSIAIDNANRLLAVRGTEAEVEAIRQLVSQLNRPKKSIGIHCFFLSGRLGSGGSNGGKKLPDDLEPVAAILDKSGLGGASLLAPVIVMTNDGERFSTQSALEVTDDSGDIENLSFRITGRASLDAGSAVQLEVKGIVVGTDAKDTRYQIETTVSTKIGSYVVLAAAPSTTLVGDYIALVVRVVATE